MSDLVEFLRARFDEDEARALAAKVTMLGDVWRVQQRRDGMVDVMAVQPRTAIVATELSPEEGEHIAAHDPARVLADVKSKRLLLRLHRECEATCYVIKVLAMPYRERPEYLEEWRA